MNSARSAASLGVRNATSLPFHGALCGPGWLPSSPGAARPPTSSSLPARRGVISASRPASTRSSFSACGLVPACADTKPLASATLPGARPACAASVTRRWQTTSSSRSRCGTARMRSCACAGVKSGAALLLRLAASSARPRSATSSTPSTHARSPDTAARSRRPGCFSRRRFTVPSSTANSLAFLIRDGLVDLRGRVASLAERRARGQGERVAAAAAAARLRVRGHGGGAAEQQLVDGDAERAPHAAQRVRRLRRLRHAARHVLQTRGVQRAGPEVQLLAARPP